MSKYLIIDANLLLLLVIGSVGNGELIKKSNRLSKYKYEDFILIKLIMEEYKGYGIEYGISQYIATEVSNLIDIKDETGKENTFLSAKLFFSSFTQIDSIIKNDVSYNKFTKFGITDSFLCNSIKDNFILTHDTRLSPLLASIKYENLIDFTIIREGVST
ncbi:PIN domain-containing protein [Acetobacter cerevisiae]|uniref:hypothetical protein n=1 Tax=Acetobacter cerevisiae TaxID=178900 RepID=UPI0012E94989|nr:hypothetical protein [Acetobacter cerevisiae]